jgi:hypothetical protein
MDIDINNLNWCSGFFQGEGYCGIAKSKRKYLDDYKYFVIKITQYYDKTPLEKFINTFGTGSVQGPYSKSRGDTGVYQYVVSGEDAENIAKNMLPYLTGKKKKQVEDTLYEIKEYRKNPREPNKPKKKSCPSGHNYLEFGKINSQGYYICKPCHAESKRKLRAKKGS